MFSNVKIVFPVLCTLFPNMDYFEQFVSLTNPTVSIDCEILRDCYESFAMYCFGRYLVACLGM